MSGETPPLSVDQASQIARTTPGLAENTEPGFANTYGPGSHLPGGLLASAVPAAGMGALGLMLLYRRYLQDRAETAPKRKIKQADWTSQLPGLHAKDMLLGGALGGGAGLLYDLAKGAPKGKRLSSALKRVLGGAAAGAVGANVLGDRFRRYQSNILLPTGYDAASKARQLVPKSVGQFLDAAVYDKPAFDPEELAKLKEHFGRNDDKAIAAIIGARRELNRIAQGVHSKNPNTDYWQKNTNGKNSPYYSLNEKNKDYLHNRGVLFGHHDTQNLTTLLADPMRVISNENRAGGKGVTGPWQTSGLFGADTLLGGQQVIARRDGKNITGRILDRYDVTPSQDETQEALKAVKDLSVFNPRWWTQKRPKAPNDYTTENTTNAGFIASLLSRLAWDKILTEEHPWVSQGFTITPEQQASVVPWRKAQPSTLQLNSEAGTK